MNATQEYITKNYEQLSTKPKAELTKEEISHVNEAIEALDTGKARVCEKIKNQWVTHQWLKQAILLYFKTQDMELMGQAPFSFFDKIPLKQWNGTEGVRVVPHALVRKGSFVESGAILMPAYVNIGAYVGTGSMIDTWATVGSCAQVGQNVHLSGGVGLGGVLEPVQASPVIIEDNVFVGSRSIIVEGVRVEQGAIIGAGVTLTASTPIIDATGKEEKIYKGYIPQNAVVIPGVRQKEFTAGTYGVPTALIIGQRNPQSDKKTSLTQALRDHNVSV